METPRPARERLDENVLEEEVDDNVRDLIIRLSSSTARGAFLANRLADIHRRIASGTSLTDHNEWFNHNGRAAVSIRLNISVISFINCSHVREATFRG